VPDNDSFQQLLARLRRRDAAAASQVFDRFAQRLVALARSRLDQRLRPRLDPEDVLQSVLRTFFVRLADGRFSLRDWDGLWGLLVCITVRKCAKARERNRAAARDVQRESAPAAGGEGDDGCWEFLDRGPGPEEGALLEEALDATLRDLTELERQAVMLSLQGEPAADVARRLGCNPRKVYRVLDHVRQHLRRLRDTDVS
jgi:DNA-directed RNA polymerase specialized sigma24 family protein